MKNLTILLPDGTFDGIVHIHSSHSPFSAIRIPRATFSQYKDELSKIGLYMFLIGNDDVYVGQSGQPLFERISNTHTGSIDSDWHTVVAFPCNNRLSDNELRFIENALCEFAHKHCPRCITSSPSKGNCSEKYRKEHYRLLPMEINVCNEYVKHIEFYISHLHDVNFFIPKCTEQTATASSTKKPQARCNSNITRQDSKVETFYFFSKSRDAEGCAEIEVYLGRDVQRHVILKKGARISASVSTTPKFKASKRILEWRKQLEFEGKLQNRIILEDIELPSPSFAASFLSGTSLAGTRDWVNSNGISFGELR